MQSLMQLLKETLAQPLVNAAARASQRSACLTFMPQLPSFAEEAPSDKACEEAGWPRLGRPLHTHANAQAFMIWALDPSNFQSVTSSMPDLFWIEH